MPAFATDRVLSGWRTNSGDTFLASLRDAEIATNQYENESTLLSDPPTQAGDLNPAYSELYDELDEEGVAEADRSELCRVRGLASERSQRVRPAPSTKAPKQDTSTVEVVKRNGKYTLVMNGVSYGVMQPGVNRFWMPRFKETVVASTNVPGDTRRVVQPVLFALRVEDFESVPSESYVEASQRVINDGTVYMDNNTIKTIKLSPYQTGSGSAGVTILPYPLICTPPPYITVNDYSKVLDRELTLKLFHMPEGDFKNLQQSFDVLVGAAEAPREEDEDLNLTDLASKAVKGVTAATKFLASTAYILLQLGVTAAQVGTKGASVLGSAGITVGAGSAAAGGLALGGAYMMWEYVRRRYKKQGVKKEELPAVSAALSSALNRGPKVYRITIDKLTNMLYRIAETRANGSTMSKNDNTLGLSIHDMAHKGWNEEAAFMQWLMYGNGSRPGRDEVTGLYPESSSPSHATLYKDSGASRAPVTLNTIGVQGLHGLSLANCRTEFSYVINIVESDGSKGPTIVIDPTRINGLDAGWLAAGYNEQFRECRRAVNCLRSRLSRLPGISRYMAAHGTLVSDSNHGVMVSEDLTDTQRLLLGRELDDADGVSIDQTELRKRLDRANSTKTKAENRQSRHNNYVARQRLRIQQTQRILQRQEARRNPNVEQIRKTNQRLEKQLQNLQEALRRQDLYADEARFRKQNADRASRLVDKTADVPRRFVNIFDYEETHRRLVKEVMGGPLFGYRFLNDDQGEETSELDAAFADDFDTQFEQDSLLDLDLDLDTDEARDEYMTTKSFWGEVKGNDPPVQEGSSIPTHVADSLVSLQASLGMDSTMIDEEADVHVRFMRFLCPKSVEADPESMRFASFIVPAVTDYTSSLITDKYVVRIIPQVLAFSSGLISTFGRVTIMQPVAVSDKTFIMQDESSLAAKSISQARSALRNMTTVFPELVRNMGIYDRSGHFCQLYTLSADTGGVSTIFRRPISNESIASDFLALSFLPDSQTLATIANADKAGGALLRGMTLISSGTSLHGVGKLLKESGLPPDINSFIAAASFAEIVSYHLVQHGVLVDDSVGFELQKIELVRSALFNARYSAQAVGSFLSENYSSGKSNTKALRYDDLTFYCIPGMSHLRVALRRLGAFANDGTSFSTEVCKNVGKALARLGSSQRTSLEGFPFACLQSSVAYIPKSVRFVEGYGSAIDIHTRSSALAYERVFLAASLLAVDNRAIACACIDVVYTRPAVLKEYTIRPLEASRVAIASKNVKAQSKWAVPPPVLSGRSAMKLRMARLRVDIHDEYKEEKALYDMSLVSSDFNQIVEADLVRKMTSLDVRDFASVEAFNPVANYMIPFGTVEAGTSRDVVHSKFEQHPVWIKDLEAAASKSVVSESDTRHLVIRSAATDKHGRPNHPLILKHTREYVELALVANKKVDQSKTSAVTIDMMTNIKDLTDMCGYINSGKPTLDVSGALVEHYRAAMHNSERLFQAIALFNAMGMAGGKNAENLRIGIDLEDKGSYHMPVLVACMCVANAIARVAIGSSSIAVVSETGAGEAKACAKLVAVCKALDAAGIRAMPFCEICACISMM
tara:strand:- start:9192 stop:13925 length:4734 start_codon:yes stop_codon:yes gene_type:complete